MMNSPIVQFEESTKAGQLQVGAMDLHAMRLGETHEREHIRFSLVHQRSELWELRSQLVGHCSPLCDRRLGAVLRKHGVDQRENHLALSLARMGQRVAQEMDSTALPGGLEHFGRSGF